MRLVIKSVASVVLPNRHNVFHEYMEDSLFYAVYAVLGLRDESEVVLLGPITMSEGQWRYSPLYDDIDLWESELDFIENFIKELNDE